MHAVGNPHSRARALFPVIFLLLSFGVQAFGATAAPVLTCQPGTLSFGSVAMGQSKTRSFTLTNTGSSAVTIAKISKYAPGFSVDGLSLPVTIGPHESIAGSITFAPRNGNAVHGSLRFDRGAILGLARMTVTGTGLTSGTLVTTPATVAFGNVPMGMSLTLMETIRNSGQSNVTLVQVDASGGAFTKGGITTPMTLTPSESVTFAAKFRPTAVGSATGSLRVISSATDSSLVVPLSGTGTTSGHLTLLPSAMNFGNVAVGSSKSQTATLTANGANVTISSRTLSSAEFALSGLSLPMSLPAGQSTSFSVTFTPQLSGTANGSLSIQNSTSTVPVSESVSGTGTSAAAHSVALGWKASRSTVVAYNVYRGSQSGGPYATVASANAGRTFTDGSVQAGKTYYYVVTALDAAGTESGYSNQVQAVIPSP
jgi:hypothetical protein